LHIGTIRKNHGRRKRKIQQSSLELAKHNNEIKRINDEGTSLKIEQNESNKRVLRFQKCSAQLTSLLPLDLIML
jgi:hypothetical protein